MRFDWWSPIIRLEREPQPWPASQINRVVEVASAFVERWADWAELVGMQPAHLLRHNPEDFGRRGIAWRNRYTGIDVVCFPRPGYLVTDNDGGTAFVYRFERDGGVVVVTGDERDVILGAFIQVQAEPSIRERYLAHEIPWCG